MTGAPATPRNLNKVLCHSRLSQAPVTAAVTGICDETAATSNTHYAVTGRDIGERLGVEVNGNSAPPSLSL